MDRKKREQDHFEKILREFANTEENKTCADCQQRGPYNIVLNFGTFVCSSCAGIHREFNHRVKGIGASNFTEEEVRGVLAAGNAVAASIWMCGYSPAECPRPLANDLKEIREFIRQKYVLKRWTTPSSLRQGSLSPRTSSGGSNGGGSLLNTSSGAADRSPNAISVDLTGALPHRTRSISGNSPDDQSQHRRRRTSKLLELSSGLDAISLNEPASPVVSQIAVPSPLGSSGGKSSLTQIAPVAAANEQSLINKRVWVIGASGSVGLAVVNCVLKRGALEAVMVSRSRQKLDLAAELLHPKLYERTRRYVCDITNEQDVMALFSPSVVGQYPIDHLVICAAQIKTGKLSDLPVSEAKQCFDVKFWGAYTVCRHASLVIAKNGSICMISGAMANRPSVGMSQLAAVNAAVEGLARGLAVELSPIRVNTVSPGLLDTPSLSYLTQEQKDTLFERFRASNPAKRVGTPDDVAHAIAMLLENPFVSGTVVHLDGGYTFR